MGWISPSPQARRTWLGDLGCCAPRFPRAGGRGHARASACCRPGGCSGAEDGRAAALGQLFGWPPRVLTAQAPVKLILPAALPPFSASARDLVSGFRLPRPGAGPVACGLSGDTTCAPPCPWGYPGRQDRGSASAWGPLGKGPPSPGEGVPGGAPVMTPLGRGHPRGAGGPSSLRSTLVVPKVPLP